MKKITDGTLIYGGDLEDQDPYATRKRLFYQSMILDSPEDTQERKKKKREEDLNSEALLKRFIEEKRKEYGG